MAKKKGVIKRFTKNDAGDEIGWLQPDEGGTEWQFDVDSARNKDIKENDHVEYEDANLPGTKGRRMAKNLKKIEVE